MTFSKEIPVLREATYDTHNDILVQINPLDNRRTSRINNFRILGIHDFCVRFG